MVFGIKVFVFSLRNPQGCTSRGAAFKPATPKKEFPESYGDYALGHTFLEAFRPMVFEMEVFDFVLWKPQG